MDKLTLYDEKSVVDFLRNSKPGECYKVVSKEGGTCLEKIEDITQRLNNIFYCVEGGGWTLAASKHIGNNFVAEIFFQSKHVRHYAQGATLREALLHLNARIANVIELARPT